MKWTVPVSVETFHFVDRRPFFRRHFVFKTNVVYLYLYINCIDLIRFSMMHNIYCLRTDAAAK